MFDPAAMGTLIIGLNADRAETQHNRPRRPALASAPRREHRGIRAVLAHGLRQVAAVLEPPTVSDVTS